MSMTSVSVSCAIRLARSGGSSGGGGGCGGAAGRGGGVQATFGAGAVPATPRTPVPHAASAATAPVASVALSNVPRPRGRGRRMSGWPVGIRLRIRLCAKGWRLDRCSPEYTHGQAGAWSLTEGRQTTVLERVRLDRWLWAARFFRTRALAAAAIGGGKVHVNGAPAKRAKAVAVGDDLRIRRGPFEYLVRVRALAEHRRSPAAAATLYDEDGEGKRLRERLAEQLRVAPALRYEGKGRPTKRQRREIERLKGE